MLNIAMKDTLVPVDMPTAPAEMQGQEEGGLSRAKLLSRYLGSSTFVGPRRIEDKQISGDLLARIDSSLLFLQIAQGPKIGQLRAAVAKLRNIIGCFIHRLPKEIQLLIFEHVVYENEEPLIKPYLAHRTRGIYHRLHQLLAVCTAWRNLCISHGAFWTIIPIVSSGLNNEAALSTELSLQRSCGRDIHLAVSMRQCQCQELLSRHIPLNAHLSRLRSIDIYAGASCVVKVIIDTVLAGGAAESISKLCLHRASEYIGEVRVPLANDYLNHCDYPLQTQFGQLIRSLSVLQIGNIPLKWGYLTFSTRMVQLRIGNIVLGGHEETAHFFKALSSASELRHLEIISVVTILGESEMVALQLPGVHVSVPNLRSLHIEDLTFADLSIFLHAITPGPQNLTTLILTPQLGLEFTWSHAWDEVEVEQVCELLSRFPIHNLTVKETEADYFWTTSGAFDNLLRSVPTLKSLILKFYTVTQEVLHAIKRHQILRLDDQNNRFPKLDNLEVHCARILGDELELQEFMEARADPSSRPTLGRPRRRRARAGLIQGSNEVIGWLKHHVPGFRLVHDASYAKEVLNTEVN